MPYLRVETVCFKVVPAARILSFKTKNPFTSCDCRVDLGHIRAQPRCTQSFVVKNLMVLNAGSGAELGAGSEGWMLGFGEVFQLPSHMRCE